MASTPATPKPSILLVDDCRDGLLVRRSLLEELGYSVQVAASGEEGLRLFQRCTFDVVVTDYCMPLMNGKELIVRIRQLDPNARVIMLSGFVEPLGLTEQNTGADAVVAKTSNEVPHLLRSVKRLLARGVRKAPAAERNSQSRVHVASR